MGGSGRTSTHLLNKVGNAHRKTDKDIDPPQDPSLLFDREIALTTSLSEDSGSFIQLIIGFPGESPLFVVVLNMIDHISVFVVKTRTDGLDVVVLRHPILSPGTVYSDDNVIDKYM